MKEEFTYESGEEITKAIFGKVVRSVKVPDSSMDDYLIIIFEDDSSLHIRYDWIYDWELKHGSKR